MEDPAGSQNPQPANSAPAGREQFPFVQVLRGFAAMWVVLYHASEGGHISNLKASLPSWVDQLIFNMDDSGVAIFFALSGFVIAHSLRDDDVTPGYIGRFALRRSIRLDPPYWAAIAFVIFMQWLSTRVQGQAFVAPSGPQLLAHVTYTQDLLGYPKLNDVFWTLCFEVQFYLVLVTAAWAARYGPQIVRSVLFLMALLWGTGILGSPPALFLGLWHCFFLGVLAYHAHKDRTALVAFGALLLALLVSGPETFTTFSCLAAVLMFVMRWLGRMNFGPRPLLALGTISYSLYLTHNPVSGAVGFLCRKFGLPDVVTLLVIIVASLAVAAMLWRLIEYPAMQFAKKIKMRHPPASGFAPTAEDLQLKSTT